MLRPCLRREAVFYRHKPLTAKAADLYFTWRSFGTSSWRLREGNGLEKGIPEHVRLLMRRVTQPGNQVS